MRISSITWEALSREQITALLFGGAPAEQVGGDCIFVFGTGKFPAERVQVAVDLYRAGRAPLLLFSGGSRWGSRPPEALVMRDLALAMGVPAERILVETDSNQTKENVLASLLVLDRALGLHRIRRLLVVSAPFHMRRCLLTLRTYMPGWIDYTWYPDIRAATRADNWWQDPESEARIRKEVESLVRYVREGQLQDEDVTQIF